MREVLSVWSSYLCVLNLVGHFKYNIFEKFTHFEEILLKFSVKYELLLLA